jgi:hypothetical protein
MVSRFPEVSIGESRSPFDITLRTMAVDRRPVCEKGSRCLPSATVPGDAILAIFTIANARRGLESATWGVHIDRSRFPVTLHFKSRPFDVAAVENCTSSGCTPMRLRHARRAYAPSDFVVAFGTAAVLEAHRTVVSARVRDLCGRVLEEIRNNRSVRTFSTHTERLAIIRAAEATRRCLDQFGTACVNFSQVSANLSVLEEQVAPMYARVAENTSAVHALNHLYGALQLCRNASRQEWPVEKPWLDPRWLAAIERLADSIENWTRAAVQKTRQQNPALGWTISSRDFEERAVRLFKAYKQIEAMQKPRKDGDAEMDDVEANAQPWVEPFPDEAEESHREAEEDTAHKAFKDFDRDAAVVGLSEVIWEKKQKWAQQGQTDGAKEDEL